ncbi:hypothetical protein R8510_04848 [Ralstonia chuxiongensis]|nr:hypothetical protein R8510_04848 [Ralstonia chuxiongensis]
MTDVNDPVADAKEPSQEIAYHSEENVAELRDSNSELAHRTGDEEKSTRCSDRRAQSGRKHRPGLC